MGGSRAKRALAAGWMAVVQVGRAGLQPGRARRVGAAGSRSVGGWAGAFGNQVTGARGRAVLGRARAGVAAIGQLSRLSGFIDR